MRFCGFVLIGCVVIISVHAPRLVGQDVLVFDDGGEHVISDVLDETVMQVLNASQVTVKGEVRAGSTIPEGAHIAELSGPSKLVIDNGELFAFDLAAYAVFARRESEVTVRSGLVTGGMVLEGSQLNMGDGVVTGRFEGVRLTQGSVAEFSGGTVQNYDDVGIGVIADDDSRIVLTGGILLGDTDSFTGVGVQLNDVATLEMTGGTISADHVIDAKHLVALQQTGESSATIRGGQLAFDIS